MNKKWIFGGLALGALGFGAYKLNNIATVANNMAIEQSFKLKVSKTLGGIPTEITLVIDTKLKNPTNKSMRMNQPFVSLYANEKDKEPFATSAAVNKEHVIPPLGEVQLLPIEIPVAVATIATIAAGLYKMIVSKKPAGIWVKTITYVNGSLKSEKFEFKEVAF
jgi:hypothetical protein